MADHEAQAAQQWDSTDGAQQMGADRWGLTDGALQMGLETCLRHGPPPGMFLKYKFSCSTK